MGNISSFLRLFWSFPVFHGENNWFIMGIQGWFQSIETLRVWRGPGTAFGSSSARSALDQLDELTSMAGCLRQPDVGQMLRESYDFWAGYHMIGQPKSAHNFWYLLGDLANLMTNWSAWHKLHHDMVRSHRHLSDSQKVAVPGCQFNRLKNRLKNHLKTH